MKLYYTPGACSLSPHIVLRELGLPHTLVRVDLKSKKTEAGGDFLSVNPKGYVPALELDNGQVLTEGPAIVQYLARQKPGLIPESGTLEHFRVVEWLTYINSELHKTFGALFYDAQDQATRKKLTTKLKFVDSYLRGRRFLVDEKFTVADAYLFTILSWADHLKVNLPDGLRQYRDGIASRPHVQEALRAEGLLAGQTA